MTVVERSKGKRNAAIACVAPRRNVSTIMRQWERLISVDPTPVKVSLCTTLDLSGFERSPILGNNSKSAIADFY